MKLVSHFKRVHKFSVDRSFVCYLLKLFFIMKLEENIFMMIILQKSIKNVTIPVENCLNYT